MILLDAHYHLYACHDRARSLRTLSRNLAALARPGDVCAACFLEPAGGHVFAGFPDDGPLAEGVHGRRLSPACMQCTVEGQSPVWLYAGRQFVTDERLEVLALGAWDDAANGQPAGVAIERIRQCGGIPVLPWGAGKWWGRRGAVVRQLLHTLAPDSVWVGDSAMRPRGWPEPDLIRLADERGFPLVAGSDPLPIAGDERWAGRYAVKVDVPFDADRPMAWLDDGPALKPELFMRTGQRCQPLAFALRQWRLQQLRPMARMFRRPAAAIHVV